MTNATPHEDPFATDRFAFGENWREFLELLSEARIRNAEESLTSRVGELRGKRFLDVGSGSGLFSLAAANLGADVVSFDYDPLCVACTQTLRDRFRPNAENWTIFRGSVLDAAMLAGLGRFDAVYSWGVLHHTGRMWEALGNLPPLVAPGGRLLLAIYNDQGGKSRRWRRIKGFVHRRSRPVQHLLAHLYLFYWDVRISLIHSVRLENPFVRNAMAAQERGMDRWRDALDWLGGFPFEVAKPEEIFDFCSARGFVLRRLKTCGGGLGCNEYVFQKSAQNACAE